MPTNSQLQACLICRSPASVRSQLTYSDVENCPRCGNYRVERIAIDDVPLPLTDIKKIAVTSYFVRKLQSGKRPILSREFFDEISKQELPSPSDLADNLLLFIAERWGNRPGATLSVPHTDPSFASAIGAVDQEDVLWAARELDTEKLIKGEWLGHFANGHITGSGWRRIEQLRRAHIASRYAFFARKFANTDLDRVYAECLKPAVKQTGYELKPVTPKAGHIDAIIENEIRRCRFLIADLSDDNAGAYWEAGFAEGLGKPVIYICREGVTTHFDTNHRQTVRWDLARLEDTAKKLKAVIRNTLLGDANQND
jgi:hypothetical protein